MLLRAVQLIVLVEWRPVIARDLTVVESEFVREVIAVRDHRVRFHILVFGGWVRLVRKHVRGGTRSDRIFLLIGVKLRLIQLHLLNSGLGTRRLQMATLGLLVFLALTVILGGRPEGSD